MDLPFYSSHFETRPAGQLTLFKPVYHRFVRSVSLGVVRLYFACFINGNAWPRNDIVADLTGTARELCSEEGDVHWRGEQGLWGAHREERRPIPLRRYLGDAANEEVYCELRYQGQLYDAETGLYYNRHRYYDAESGQYLSPDPIGLNGGINLYSYVSNPLSWIDPLGLCKVNSGADVTPDIIRDSLKGDTMQTLQGSVSLPAIQRYVDRLLKGDIAPPIKVDGNIVVEGNHRYIAGKVVGKMPEMSPGTLPPSKLPDIKPMSSTIVDDFDWGNY